MSQEYSWNFPSGDNLQCRNLSPRCGMARAVRPSVICHRNIIGNFLARYYFLPPRPPAALTVRGRSPSDTRWTTSRRTIGLRTLPLGLVQSLLVVQDVKSSSVSTRAHRRCTLSRTTRERKHNEKRSRMFNFPQKFLIFDFYQRSFVQIPTYFGVLLPGISAVFLRRVYFCACACVCVCVLLCGFCFCICPLPPQGPNDPSTNQAISRILRPIRHDTACVVGLTAVRHNSNRSISSR